MCNGMMEAPAIGGAGYSRGADGTRLSYSVVTPQEAPLPRYNYYLEPGAIIVTKLAP